jgi:DNA-binding XRE family transcriptional regulator
MPQPKPGNEDLKMRNKRAQDWKMFRRNNMFTQKRLAEIIGISRRTLQKIEGGHIIPHPTTLRKFASFKRKYDVNADLNISA